MIEQLWPGRYWIRQDGNEASRDAEGSLSVVFARLWRWGVLSIRPPAGMEGQKQGIPRRQLVSGPTDDRRGDDNTLIPIT
jgi:hypothetical protein